MNWWGKWSGFISYQSWSLSSCTELPAVDEIENVSEQLQREYLCCEPFEDTGEMDG